MDYTIKTYNSDPDIDFNQVQATIYNNVVNKYTGNTVTTDEIRERIEKDKFDANGMMYAFTIENKPLAYIRYYLYPSGNLYIGYPWCIDECPEDVQERLFSDLKAYIKRKFPDKTIARLGFADNRITPFHEFARKKNLEKAFWEVEFNIDVEEFSKINLGEFSYRESTETDLESLVTIAMEDFVFYGQEKVLNKEETKKYFRNVVFKHGNCVAFLKNDEIIGSTSPWRNKPWNNSLFTFIRYESILRKYEKHRYLLYVTLAKLLHDKGLVDEKLFFSKDNTQEQVITKLEQLGVEKKGGASCYNVIL